MIIRADTASHTPTSASNNATGPSRGDSIHSLLREGMREFPRLLETGMIRHAAGREEVEGKEADDPGCIESEGRLAIALFSAGFDVCVEPRG